MINKHNMIKFYKLINQYKFKNNKNNKNIFAKNPNYFQINQYRFSMIHFSNRYRAYMQLNNNQMKIKMNFIHKIKVLYNSKINLMANHFQANVHLKFRIPKSNLMKMTYKFIILKCIIIYNKYNNRILMNKVIYYKIK